MSNDFVIQRSLGYSVYGVEQYDYTVNDVAGYYFGKAVSEAAMLRALAVEETLIAYTQSVEMRRTKIMDLSRALGYVSSAGTHFESDDDLDERYPEDEEEYDDDLITAYDIMNKYGVDLTYMHRGYIIHEDVQRNTQTLQYEIDLENTELQEDMTMLESMISERDSAYELASQVRTKTDDTSSGTIGNIK